MDALPPPLRRPTGGNTPRDRGARVARAVATAGAALGAVSLRPRGGGRGRESRPLSQPGRKCSDALLAVTMVAYAAQLLSRGALLAWGAKVNASLRAGELWRLLTPALLHGSLPHLLVNCYSLHDLGPAVERLLGGPGFLALCAAVQRARAAGASASQPAPEAPPSYAGSAACGNAASFVLSPRPGVGASGAIFGLVGCLGVHYVRHARLLGAQGEQRLAGLTRVVGVNLVVGLLSPGIDNAAHLGGLLGGAALSALFGPRLVANSRGVLTNRPWLRLTSRETKP